MLCKVCRHCGLCEGDGSFSVDEKTLIVASGTFEKKIQGDSSALPNEIGIAVDMGTTTLALRAYSLKTGELLSERSQENAQRAFGSDVVSRVNYALKKEGLALLHNTLLEQIASLSESLVRETKALLLSKRIGRAKVTRMVLCGNTTMERFFTNKNMEGLAAFPFTTDSEFGSSLLAKDFFSDSQLLSEAEIFISPTVSAFVGGDTVCALLASFFHENNFSGKAMLCDLGTNCELALCDFDSDKITATSCAAGPAFEAQGISCGMSASEGAITSVWFTDKTCHSSVIGGGQAEGLCGTGLLSSIAALVKENILLKDGSFSSGQTDFYFSDRVFLSQKDVRSFQLAKAAVRSGLDYLCEKNFINEKEKIPLYLVGGFGTKLSVSDVETLGMIPAHLCKKVHQTGNAALDGASLLLTDFSLREKAKTLAKKTLSLNLAESDGFQERFLRSLALEK